MYDCWSTPRIFRIWQACRIFTYFNDFFLQKVKYNWFSSILSVHLSMCPKSKKWSQSVKNDTKAGIMRAWNEIRPKLFHQHLDPLIKELLKNRCQHKLWSLDLWPWINLYPKKAQIEQKIIIVFIEIWKEIGPWCLTYLLFLILAIFRG